MSDYYDDKKHDDKKHDDKKHDDKKHDDKKHDDKKHDGKHDGDDSVAVVNQDQEVNTVVTQEVTQVNSISVDDYSKLLVWGDIEQENENEQNVFVINDVDQAGAAAADDSFAAAVADLDLNLFG